MKTLKITLLLLSMLLLCPINGQAQEQNERKIYRVHEDQVKLSMVSEYESIVKELVALLNKHKLPDLHWITLASSDSKYRFISPIKNMADLDKPSWIGALAEKEGKDAINGLFDRMDKCYDTELDYILRLDEELTYMPEGFNQTPEGENYRKNHMLYVSPGNRDVVREKMKAIKDFNVKKGSKVSYRIYRSGFGSDGEYYMVAIAAKDAEHYAKRSKENQEILGDERKKVMGDLWSNLLKYEVIEGWIRPELAYSSK
jgi:hypothetical protein